MYVYMDGCTLEFSCMISLSSCIGNQGSLPYCTVLELKVDINHKSFLSLLSSWPGSVHGFRPFSLVILG